MPAHVRQLILDTLEHAVGWHQDRIKEILRRWHKIPFETTVTELDLMVREEVVERTEHGFVSLPEKSPISLLDIVARLFSVFRSRVYA